MKIKILIPILVLFSLPCLLRADSGELKLADIFSDGMVIQKDYDLPIWGEDQPGKKIKVSIAGQELSATADKDGRWRVTAAPISNAGPFQMDIQSESGKVSIKDIVCGEVWLFAGESAIDANLDKDIAKPSGSEKPSIRYFRAPKQITRVPYGRLPGKWKKCEDLNNDIPAVAYHFADELRTKTSGPVGIILCAVPNSLSQAWCSRDCLRGVKPLAYRDDYQEMIQNYEVKISGTYKGLQEINNVSGGNLRYAGAAKRFQMWAGTPEGRKAFKAGEVDQWQEKIQEWVENSMQRESKGTPISEDEKSWPQMIQISSGVVADPRTSGVRPAGIFNGMISPLVPFAIKGFVFWQGESDASWKRGDIYNQILTTVIRNWRDTWQKGQAQKKGELPFVIMQLQGVGENKGISADECSLLRLSQVSVQEKLSNTALAVSYDIIHDSGEAVSQDSLKEAGRRLSLAALGKFYSQKITWSGPLFEAVSVGENSHKLKFKFADKGMIAGKDGSDDKVKGFEIGDPNGDFKPADAVIEKNFIVLKIPGVTTVVRYGWGLNPDANLYSSEGLPAVTFTVSLSEK